MTGRSRRAKIVCTLGPVSRVALRSQLAFSWGIETFLVPSVERTDEMVGR
jgi:pyruvate kinase